MKQLLIFVSTIIRIAVVFLGVFSLSNLVVFRHFYDGKNDDLVFGIQLVVVFLINFIWYKWKEKKGN
ncbi:hypothetical protein [Brevibacillus reuszeri]|uniref:hypothetical protein n=1 Tax=Brevibacillus reuszeri TaxID=54915 RepID=UPI003D1EF536